MDTLNTKAVGIGVDIGQKVDPTAIVVAEREDRNDITHFNIRLIERLPLGTSYPQVAIRVAEIVQRIEQRARSQRLQGKGFTVELNVDATGIGQAITDLLVEKGLTPTECYFVAGDKRTERGNRSVSVGKGYLVGRLQVLLQASRIHLPQTAEATAMASELQNFEIKVNDNANAQYGAFKTGTHDDLVTALGLAVGFDDQDNRVHVWSYKHPNPNIDPDLQRMEGHMRWQAKLRRDAQRGRR